MVQVLNINHRNGKLALINLHSESSGDGGEQVLLYYNDGMEGIDSHRMWDDVTLLKALK